MVEQGHFTGYTQQHQSIEEYISPMCHNQNASGLISKHTAVDNMHSPSQGTKFKQQKNKQYTQTKELF